MSKYPPDPSTDDLLQALEIYLREEVDPVLQGYGKFRTRVALNVLGMLRRQYQGEEVSVAQASKISALADDLRTDRTSWRDKEALDLARAENIDRLKISNPKWLLQDE
jgi:hypothetical protein